MAKKRLPVTIITGFLGAGKTTLLRHLLIHSQQKLGVMVNEFGSVGLDGDLLKTCGFCSEEEGLERIVELNNGCLCCTVQDDFLPSLNKLIERSMDLDGIIIETSGLALPRPLLKALDWPDVRSRVYINGVITLVDGEAFLRGSPVGDLEAIFNQKKNDKSLDHETPIDELFKDQLKESNLVLISRSDKISSDSLDNIKSDLKNFTKKTTIFYPIANGKIKPSLILDSKSDYANSDYLYQEVDDETHNHLTVFSGLARCDVEVDLNVLKKVLQELIYSYQIIRVKGKCWIKGKALPLQFQMVGERVSTWYEASPGSSWKPSKKAGIDLVLLSFKDGASEALIHKVTND